MATRQAGGTGMRHVVFHPRPGICAVFAVLLTLFAVPARPVAADQTDPRLGGLFSALSAAPDAETAAGIEQQIWQIWLQSDDPRTDRHMVRGVVFMSAGQFDDAVAQFSAAIELAPDFAEAWNKRATVHYLMNQHDRSMQDIRQTLALEPRHFGAISGMGLIFLALDDQQTALKAFEEVLVIHPMSVSARANADALRQSLGMTEF